jgi:putative nucleotidyltransferase with HDIG domain
MVLQRGDVLVRLAMCFATAVAVWAISGAWAPAFTFREDYLPPRDVTARVPFTRPDPDQTRRDQDKAFEQEPYVYKQDPKELDLRRADLDLLLAEILKTEDIAELKPDTWKQFLEPQKFLEAKSPPAPTPTATADSPTATTAKPTDAEQQADAYRQFRSSLVALGGEEKVKAALDRVFAPLKLTGFLDKLPDDHSARNREEIRIYQVGKPNDQSRVPLAMVLQGADKPAIRNLIRDQFGNSVASDRLGDWLIPRLHSTLTLDNEASRRQQEAARDGVEPKLKHYESGMLLAAAGKPIQPETLSLLRSEHEQYVASLGLPRRAERSAAVFGLILSLYVLCGYYMYFREPKLLGDLRLFATLLASVVFVIAAVHWTTVDPWRAELIPLLLFGMTFGIAYHRDVALILATSMAIIVAMTGGEGLGEFIVLMGTVSSAVLQLGSIRTRSKLIRVGFTSAIVAFLLSLGMGMFDEQPLGMTIVMHAGRNALWAFLTGFLMTGLLPYVEKLFGVLTDLSLLELGDASHPLLQELVRRAPGTYNHSINVASLAEAAAESIGARGLLVRVGAYFHDIGKMLKPNYFVENQGGETNRHENLLPAMSTLIIIAHVKDGADLARQHRLPQTIIDFIEQHHGTTLVEYFYRRANEKSEADPDGGEVLESSYRYPGPKPQTVEAAVLMLADSVEGASRTLVEPTSSRIENLVEQIGMNKMLDGQFDECGLTLQQLRLVEDSLIKSLTAVYHGRVKYASTATA